MTSMTSAKINTISHIGLKLIQSDSAYVRITFYYFVMQNFQHDFSENKKNVNGVEIENKKASSQHHKHHHNRKNISKSTRIVPVINNNKIQTYS